MGHSIKEKTDIFNEICDNVIENKISFNKAVEKSPINLVTFYKWITENEIFEKLYKYAREIRSDVLFEEIIEIADTTEEGEVTKISERGIEVKKGDMTDHRRLKVDARKWVVARMQPKKYGDKIDVTSGDEPIKQSLNITVDSSDTAKMLNDLRNAGGKAN
jgi:hypothetical protein